jgi:hypothetical protein
VFFFHICGRQPVQGMALAAVLGQGLAITYAGAVFAQGAAQDTLRDALRPVLQQWAVYMDRQGQVLPDCCMRVQVIL